MGDGNLHFNIMQPKSANREDYLSHWSEMNDLIHDLVVSYKGSVSAEHGVGRLKRNLIARTKDAVEIDLMRSIKNTLDPYQIMNPGKVI